MAAKYASQLPFWFLLSFVYSFVTIATATAKSSEWLRLKDAIAGGVVRRGD
jgi:hypothetical protein